MISPVGTVNTLKPGAVGGRNPVITGISGVYVNGFGFGSAAGTVTVNSVPRGVVSWGAEQVRISGSPVLPGDVVVLTNMWGRSSSYTV